MQWAVVRFTLFLSLVLLALVDCGGGGAGSNVTPGPVGPPPQLLSVSPGNNASGIPTNGAIVLTFDQAMQTVQVTLTSGAGSPCTGVLVQDGTRYLFLPDQDLAPNALFNLFVAATASGGALTRSVNFQTGAQPAASGTLTAGSGLSIAQMSNVEIREAAPSDNGSVTLSQSSVLSADGGRFAFPSLPVGKHLFVAEKTYSSGSTRRILGVATVVVGSGGGAKVSISMGNVTPTADNSLLSAYCIDCHPATVTRAGQVAQCAHAPDAGHVPANAIPQDASMMDSYGRITCESCHTVHAPSGFAHFVVAQYTGSSGFCNLCH